MRPTVHDIAEKAGVSLATVDRVLNRRPGVRTATRAHVEAVIEKIGYVRDIAAANLAKGRVYPLVFIIPGGSNSFMGGLRDEIRAAIGRSGQERTHIRLVEVPPFDGPSLARALSALLAEPPAGIAVVAVDDPAVFAAFAALKEAGVAIVTLVSDLPGSARDHFAGVDNIAAGRTAVSLMGRFLRGVTGDVAVVAGSMLVRDHRERLEGFSAGLPEVNPGLHPLAVMEGHDDPEEVHALIGQCLRLHPDIKGIYSLGGGNRGLIKALSETRFDGERPVVIAHELSPFTRAALEDGQIDVILNQDAGHEVRSAIRVLKAKVDGLPVIDAQERIRLDIFVKDNLP